MFTQRPRRRLGGASPWGTSGPAGSGRKASAPSWRRCRSGASPWDESVERGDCLPRGCRVARDCGDAPVLRCRPGHRDEHDPALTGPGQRHEPRYRSDGRATMTGHRGITQQPCGAQPPPSPGQPPRRRRHARVWTGVAGVFAAVVLAACGSTASSPGPGPPVAAGRGAPGRHRDPAGGVGRVCRAGVHHARQAGGRAGRGAAPGWRCARVR